MTRLFFLILTTSILILITPASLSQEAPITGEAITGQLTSQPLQISIFVTGGPPSLAIERPTNSTYLKNTSLLLLIKKSNADNVWYSFDSSSNTTLFQNQTLFNISEGNHFLQVWANNSDGTATRNVTFAVNLTKLRILYETYKNRENTTNLENYTYEELLSSLINISLEKQDAGMIQSLEAINITADEFPYDNLIDLDSNILMSQDSIFINITALPNFNVSSTFYFYNVSFSNPRVLLDDVICPTTICKKNSFNSSILIINVTQGGRFTLEETPNPPTTPSSAPPLGGWGGSASETIYPIESYPEGEIITDPSEITLQIIELQNASQEIIIINKRNETVNITLDILELEGIISLNNSFIILNKDEIGKISIEVFASANIIPGIYIGKIRLTTDRGEQYVPIALIVKSKKTVIDIKLELDNKYKIFKAGEETSASIKLLNTGDKKETEIALEYGIKDTEGKTILSKREHLMIEKELSLERKLTLPNHLPKGNYIWFAQVTHQDGTASAIAWFSIEESYTKINKTKNYILIGIIILIIIILFLRLVNKWVTKKRTKPNKR